VSVPEQMNINEYKDDAESQKIDLNKILTQNTTSCTFLFGRSLQPQYYSLKFFSLITGIYLEKIITNLKQV